MHQSTSIRRLILHVRMMTRTYIVPACITRLVFKRFDVRLVYRGYHLYNRVKGSFYLPMYLVSLDRSIFSHLQAHSLVIGCDLNKLGVL